MSVNEVFRVVLIPQERNSTENISSRARFPLLFPTRRYHLVQGWTEVCKIQGLAGLRKEAINKGNKFAKTSATNNDSMCIYLR